jgi:N-acetyl sugar amidotransferase
MAEEFGMYGLPLDVKYCRKCTISNQRPSSTIEFKNKGGKKRPIAFGDDGICEACRYAEKKKQIDWTAREKELRDLCDRFRRTDGHFDVIVPGSGGKDSVMAAHVLKYKYNMHPILITWPPHLYTRVGRRNFEAWRNSGFANYTYFPNQRVHRILTRNAFENLCHPFQPFIIGQKNLAPRFSINLKIPLVMFGENEAEYGNPVADNVSATRDSSYFAHERNLDEIYLGGKNAKDLMKEYDLSIADLDAYLPAEPADLDTAKTEVHYLGYYLKWHPQETYYYSVENTDFLPNDFRTEGSYSKYSSIDDKIDWLHYYTTHIKFGIGRATEDSAQEIRNEDITREEGIRLIRRFDGEFPMMYLKENLEYMGITEKRFYEVTDAARPPHLWKNVNGKWELKHKIWEVGVDSPLD